MNVGIYKNTVFLYGKTVFLTYDNLKEGIFGFTVKKITIFKNPIEKRKRLCYSKRSTENFVVPMRK